MLQETHWSESREWAADGWFFCHSASSKPKSGGILIALKQDTFDHPEIRWQELIPGRLLHVRAHAGKQHLDMVGIYQHALPFTGELLEDVMKKRAALWKAADKLIGAFPARASVIIGGDLNSALEPAPPFVGPGIHQGPDRPHLVEERRRIGEILQRHGLCALNSWSQKRYTYQHPSGRSQIDYVFIRRALADGAAKRASPINVPMAGWRSSGHQPIKASILWDWRPWKYAMKQELSQLKKHITKDGNHLAASKLASIAQKAGTNDALLRASLHCAEVVQGSGLPAWRWLVTLSSATIDEEASSGSSNFVFLFALAVPWAQVWNDYNIQFNETKGAVSTLRAQPEGLQIISARKVWHNIYA